MNRRTWLGLAALAPVLSRASAARALGPATAIELVGLALAGLDDARPLARSRLAWALRLRTSLEVALEPRTVGLADPALFDCPFLYVSGAAGFPLPSVSEAAALRRHVELGGFLLIDDASDGRPEFDASVRAMLRRVFPDRSLRNVPPTHTIHHSFYLVDRAVGRVVGPAEVEGIDIDGRLGVIYSRHDLGGAYSRDTLGNYTFPVTPGGEAQRERAFRFGVNLVMYSLCLDYKDDQVHVPFIMRRRPGRP